MRRLVMLGAVVLVAGCRDAFTGHQDRVARVGDQELSVERVATLIAPAKQVPLRRDVVDRIAELWVDYQALAAAVARGDSLTDSATMAEATWPLVAQALANHLHDTLVASVRTTPAQVDSAFNTGDVRYVSHILVRVQGDTSAAAKAAKRRLADGYLAQLRRGANFADLARRVSDDPSARQSGGNLGLVQRGAMVRPFEDAAFSLEPGQLSEVVETAFGFHVVWRPALAVVRDSFAVALDEELKERFDSLYLDSLTTRTGISVRKRAPVLVRNAAGAMRLSARRSRTLATYRGGRLTEGEFVRWLRAFPAQTRGMVLQADDSTLTEFVRSITRNVMLIEGARARGIALTPADWDTIRGHYTSDLAQMLGALGLSPESLATDTAAPGAGRVAAAARHVDSYLTDITSRPGSRPYVEVPPFLAEALRARASWSIEEGGVNRALERARTLRGPETPPGGPMGAPATPLRPAPGGPPMGAPQGGQGR